VKRFLVAALLTLAPPAWAHPGVHERVDEVTREIAAHPDDAALYLQRAELLITHGAFAEARRDVRKARALAPSAEADLVEGMLEVEARRPTQAITALSRFLEERPDHAKGRVLRARAYVALGNPAAAVTDLDHAIAHAPTPRPELYVRRARLLTQMGQPDVALHGLDAAIATHGPLVVLVELAIEIETARSRHDAALAYLGRLPPKLRHSPLWQKRAGDLHLAAGRADEARLAYETALDALSKMPAARRRAPALAELDAELRAALASRPQ